MQNSAAPAVPRLVSEPATAFTTRRIDAIVGRFYSIVLALSGVEIVTNGLRQSQYLQPGLFWLILALNVGPIVAMLVGNWFFESRRRWYVLHAACVALSLALWPLAPVSAAGLPQGVSPFIWWSMGWAGISAGLGFSRVIAAVFITLAPVVYGILETSPAGSNAPVGRAVQDGLYTFLISATLTAVFNLLRSRAEQQDRAAELANEAEASAAAANAVAEERLRLSAVVHTQVLSALNSAIDAYSPQQQAHAAELAQSALRRLSGYDREFQSQADTVTVAAFFDALTGLLQDQAAKLKVSASMKGNFVLPLEVANALSEATMQAVANSVAHAGGATTERKVTLRSFNEQLKITVVDDGRGFRPSRVPKNRLGIQVLIFKRVAQVGGQSHINSKPGEGTTVVIEWQGKRATND